MSSNRNIVRLYARVKPKGNNPARLPAKVHAYCPCTLSGEVQEFATVEDAQIAAEEANFEATMCARSQPAPADAPADGTDEPAEDDEPQGETDEQGETPAAAQSDDEPETAAEQQPADEDDAEDEQSADPAEPVAETEPQGDAQDGESADDESARDADEPAEDDEPQGEQPEEPSADAQEIAIEGDEPETPTGLSAAIDTLMGEASGTGTTRRALIDAVQKSIAALLAHYRTATEDERTDAFGQFSVSNMDNNGRVRRELIEHLVTELGGATDAYGVNGPTGSGIYSFTVVIFAPKFVVDALTLQILPVLFDRLPVLHRFAADQHRETLRENGVTDAREFARAVSAFARSFIGDVDKELTKFAAEADVTGTIMNVVPFTSARDAHAVQRRHAAKLARNAAKVETAAAGAQS